MQVGVAAWRLGAGRARQEDVVSAGAGVIRHARPGDTIRAGEPLFTLLADDEDKLSRGLDALSGAATFGPTHLEFQGGPLVLDRIGSEAPGRS